MRSALYYPHTSVDDENLLKTALLLWDRLEFIVPWLGFQPRYNNRHIAQAMELIGKPHSPTEDEKKRAHRLIGDLANRRLPTQFYFKKERIRPHERYEIYPQKLMHETRHTLQRSQLSGRMLRNSDYLMTQPAGLIIMSILADCCAGNTRSRVTDRGDAYATLAGILRSDSNDSTVRINKSHEEALVPITLRIVDTSSITMSKLMALREREHRDSGHSLRDLRHRYVDSLEKYVKILATTQGSASDADEIKRQFEDDMSIDLVDLKQELGFARRDAIFSKEILVTTLASIGTVATAAFGLSLPILGAVTVAGLPATIGGLLGATNKYFSARKSILQKHPMAYLYELKKRTGRASIFTGRLHSRRGKT